VNFLWKSTPEKSPAYNYKFPDATPDVAPPDNRKNDIYHEYCNCFRKWSQIRPAHAYPFFIDPAVGWDWGLGFTAYPSAPTPPNAVYNGQMPHKSAHGVGAHHGRDRLVNASFADGHVASVPLEDIRKLGDRWFQMR
jgi:prepilin-type processing-associated H-X9-DG protein